MNYVESKQILEEIKRAKRILINCHRIPDSDSIGSALALYEVLRRMDKEVNILCPTDVFGNLGFLKNFEKIQKNVNFSSFDFSKHDLLIILDSSSWLMVTDLIDFKEPNIRTVVIDHHTTNSLSGGVTLIDTNASSVAEILYLVFQDWNLKFDNSISNCMLTGIIGDTGIFRFPSTSQKTLRIAADLMDKGANKDEIIYYIYGSTPVSLIKFYAEALSKLRIDKKNKFVWTAIPYKVYKKVGPPVIAREASASNFISAIDETDFGFVAVEDRPNRVSVSFRSRTGVDVSKIAKKLGGGGRVYASGAVIEGLSFKKAVRKILDVAKTFAKENAK